MTENEIRQAFHCESELVGAVICVIAPELSDEQLRQVLLDEWTRCEAHKPLRADLLEVFKRVGWVADDKTPWDRRKRNEILTIYRGNQGEDEPQGLCWTWTVAEAERFALWCQSLRGWYLGIKDPDGWPTVWQAQVRAGDVLAYFNDRGEQEIVVDPATLYNVEAIREAQREESA